MTEHTYPLELLRAELGRAISDLKVDLIERFASKGEVVELRKEFVAQQHANDKQFKEIKGALEQLLAEKDGRDAVAVDRSRRTAQWWVGAGVFVTLLIGLLTIAATLASRALFG